MRKYFFEKPDIGSILLDTIDDVINKKIEEFSREGEKRESDNIITTNILSFLCGSGTIDNYRYVYITSGDDPTTIKVYTQNEDIDSLSIALRYKLSVDQLKRIKETEDRILA
jgi:hypothetical protein